MKKGKGNREVRRKDSNKSRKRVTCIYCIRLLHILSDELLLV